MKLLAWAGIVAALLLGGVLATTAPAQGDPGHLAICHVPPGNPSNVHSIGAGAASVAKHVGAHGDFYDLDGAWSGPFSQPPVMYPIVVEFRDTCSAPGSVVASVDYPTIPCSGTWTLESAAGTTFVVEEGGLGPRCFNGCRYSLTLDPVANEIDLAGLPGCAFDATAWSAVLSRTP